jgi:histidyl-tRNA synthetase
MSKKFQPVRGMRDIIGKEAKVKRQIEKVISDTAMQYGFEPMQTPILENLDLLTAKGGGGEEVGKELYLLEDQAGRALGMRFELTTSLARVVISNPDLPKPIKTFNIGTVYRYNNPQAYRFREFTQADCDIIGSNSSLADVECATIAIDVMQKLCFNDFYIRVNDRRLVNELLLLTGIPAGKGKEAMKILDKLDKIGEKGVKKELQAKKIPTGILAYLNAPLKKIKTSLEKKNFDLEGAEALESFFDKMKKLGKEKFVKFDPSMVRGLEYYTGIVFEIFSGINVSVGGGGRYDHLIKDFGGPLLPAVGISFGVDRIMAALGTNAKISTNGIYVIPIGKTQEEAFVLVSELREKGLKAEMDLQKRNVGKNMNYANAKQIPIVLFLGEDELKKNAVKVRNMENGEEELVKTKPMKKLVEYLEKLVKK